MNKMKSNKQIPLTLYFVLLLFSLSISQTNAKYNNIDGLIEKNSIIDAMTALKELKENFAKDSTSGEYWLRYSKASYILYKYEEAKLGIDKAIKLNPKNSELYFEKGLLYNRISELDVAFTELDKAVNLNPKGIYLYWRGIVRQRLKKMEEAKTDYRSAIESGFECAELYSNFSIILCENENYEEALRMINKAITFNTKYPQAYSARSKINVYLLNIDSACIDRERAIQMRYYKVFEIPDSVCNGSLMQKWQYAADMCAFTNNYKQGIVAYSKLIDKQVLKSDYFLNRGYCYYKLKDYVNAEKDYLKALTFPNAAKDILFDDLSLLYYDQSKFQQSIEYSSKRIELNPNNHVPYIDRGLCYRKLKRYKEAENDFNASLKLKPNFFRAFGYRAFLYFELEQYDKAFDDANKSIEINPEYGYGYLVLADLKQKRGLPDLCLDLYNAKKYGESNAEIGIKLYCK